VVLVAALSARSLAVIEVIAIFVIAAAARTGETTAIGRAKTMAIPPSILVIQDPPYTMVSLGRGAMNSLLLHQFHQ
jgi:hypothetical protein